MHEAFFLPFGLLPQVNFQKQNDWIKGYTFFLSSDTYCHSHFLKGMKDFPGGTVVKNPPANAGDTGSSPGPGRSHMPRSN